MKRPKSKKKYHGKNVISPFDLPPGSTFKTKIASVNTQFVNAKVSNNKKNFPNENSVEYLLGQFLL